MLNRPGCWWKSISGFCGSEVGMMMVGRVDGPGNTGPLSSWKSFRLSAPNRRTSHHKHTSPSCARGRFLCRLEIRKKAKGMCGRTNELVLRVAAGALGKHGAIRPGVWVDAPGGCLTAEVARELHLCRQCNMSVTVLCVSFPLWRCNASKGLMSASNHILQTGECACLPCTSRVPVV